jgi:hypothetical protein
MHSKNTSVATGRKATEVGVEAEAERKIEDMAIDGTGTAIVTAVSVHRVVQTDMTLVVIDLDLARLLGDATTTMIHEIDPAADRRHVATTRCVTGATGGANNVQDAGHC